MPYPQNTSAPKHNNTKKNAHGDREDSEFKQLLIKASFIVRSLFMITYDKLYFEVQSMMQGQTQSKTHKFGFENIIFIVIPPKHQSSNCTES